MPILGGFFFFSFMKILSWNIRGLGRREKKRAVRRLVAKCKLNMLFLQEFKMQLVDHRDIRSI